MGSSRLVIFALCLIALILPILIRNVLLLTILVMCCYYAYLALCWNLVGGYAGVLSLAHGIFYGFGAYTTVLLFVYWGVTPWVGMICGAIVAAIAAFLMGSLLFSFRLKGFYFIAVTLAMTQIFQEVAKQLHFLGGADGMPLPAKIGWKYFQFRGRVEYYYIILFLLFAVIAISALIRSSRMGYNLFAVREDEDAAEASGVDAKKNKNLIFTLSAFLTALGGAFYVQFTYFVDPEIAFSATLNITLILAVVIGGIGSIQGPIFGGFFYVLLSELLRFLPMQSQIVAALAKVSFALGVMLVMIHSPRGISGLGVFKRLMKATSRQ